MQTEDANGSARRRGALAVLIVAVLCATLAWFGLHGDPTAEPVATHAAEVSPGSSIDAAGAERRARRVHAADAAGDAAPAGSAQTGTPAAAGTWRFTVVADADGAPIDGAVLVAGDDGAKRNLGSTGADGRCDVVAAELDRVEASAPGRVTAAARVKALADREYVFRLAAAGVVRGRVETPDGAPAVSVGVQLCSQNDVRWHETTTDTAGRFEFPSWALGKCGYVVAGRVSLAWQPSDRPRWCPATSEPFRLSAERPDVDLALRLERPALLVLDAVGPDGGPATGPVDFRVSRASGSSSTRDRSPHREFPADPGRIAIEAVGPDGIADPVVVDVGPGERVERILRLRAAVAISGTVVGADGAPCADATVSWTEQPAIEGLGAGSHFLPPLATDEGGRFALSGLRPGRYVARIERAGDRMPRRVEIVAPAADVVVRLGPPARVRFVVPVADGEPPAESVRVRWVPDGDRRFECRTDHRLAADGAFVAEFPGGRASLRIDVADFPVLLRDVTIAPGETLDLGALALPPERVVTARVIDADGRPAPPLTWITTRVTMDGRLVPSGGTQIVERDGRCAVRLRDADGVFLAAQVPGFAPAFAPVPRGAPKGDIDLRLVRGGTLRVRVSRRDGRPAREAMWRAEPSIYEGFASIDADGVSTGQRAPGAVRVIVRAGSGPDVTRDVVVAEGETTDVDVVVPE